MCIQVTNVIVTQAPTPPTTYFIISTTSITKESTTTIENLPKTTTFIILESKITPKVQQKNSNIIKTTKKKPLNFKYAQNEAKNINLKNIIISATALPTTNFLKDHNNESSIHSKLLTKESKLIISNYIKK